VNEVMRGGLRKKWRDGGSKESTAQGLPAAGWLWE